MARGYQLQRNREAATVARRAIAHLRRGHPWIWSRSVSLSGKPRPGTLVDLRDRSGRALGSGFCDPESPIRVRVLAGPGIEPDREWVATRAARAAALRLAAPALRGAEAMRLIHGEADGLPGLVLDRYGPIAAVRFDGGASSRFWGPHLEAILGAVQRAGHPVTGLYRRGRGAVAGEPPPSPLAIAEGGARFEVDLEAGHKTGLFLDQRGHRLRVGELAGGREVLNLFGYTGGFSIHALLGGARRVVTVDSAAPAIAAARRNFLLNDLDPDRNPLVVGDAFEYLGSAARFDLVACDPPSFAPRRSARDKALRAYRRLNQLALKAVAPGGLLVTCSCSSHVSRDELETAVGEAAAALGRGVSIVDRGGAGPDHPIQPAFPEGEYLKVLYAAVR